MAISATYLILQRQIADELGDRQDLLAPLSDSNLTLSPIQNAIQSAIAKWEREPFYFNELYDQGAFSTVIGQEFYTITDVPAFASLPYIQKVRVLINNNRYTLEPRTWQYLEDISVNPQSQSSFPYDFAYFAGTMRFYPTPAQAIPVTLMCNQKLTPLVSDGDSNVWTQDGYDLIRSEAKLILAQEVLFDDDIAARMNIAIYGAGSQMGYLYALRAETSRRGAGGRIRPSHF
jgi:hypothetical protein